MKQHGMFNSHDSLDLHFLEPPFWDRLDNDQWPETKRSSRNGIEFPDQAEIYNQKKTTCKHRSVDSKTAIATLWNHEIMSFLLPFKSWVTGE